MAGFSLKRTSTTARIHQSGGLVLIASLWCLNFIYRYAQSRREYIDPVPYNRSARLRGGEPTQCKRAWGRTKQTFLFAGSKIAQL